MMGEQEWAGLDADEAYWALMPAETQGEPSPSDCLVQGLLEARANIKLEGYGRGGDNDYADGYLAGRAHGIEQALRLALRLLDVSPRKGYIVEHVLGQTATP